MPALFPSPGMWGIMVGKAEWKLVEPPLLGRTANQAQCCIPGGVGISAAIKDWEGEVVVTSARPHSCLLCGLQETDGSWRMTAYYHWLSEVVALIAQGQFLGCDFIA